MTQFSMFETGAHDPGGKVRFPMPPGMRGDAVFAGARQEYRPLLRRWLGDVFPSRYVLWIGMNPSMANELENDPTIGREWSFTRRIGYEGYAKVNLSDYRATKPKDLLAAGLRLESDDNRKTIIETALGAEVVICGWGAVNRALQPIEAAVMAELRAAGVQTYCLGRTASGAPRHPLYLKADSPLQMFGL